MKMLVDAIKPMNNNEPLQVLYGWDFSTLKKYLVQKGIYAESEIDEIELEYKRFLHLNLENRGQKIPIAEKIDDFWHGHILFTEDYRDMCSAVFGKFFDHRPCILDGGIEALDPYFRSNTLPMYAESFGTPKSSMWLQGSQVCTGNDGSCHGDL